MKIIGFGLMIAVAGFCHASEMQVSDQGPMVIYQSEESFEDVIDNVKMAIEERGMLVSGTLHVSDMLNRTGPDLGYKQIFEKAESVEFCSASLSHQMTQLAAENMAICPFTISVYIKVNEPGPVYVAYRRQQLSGDAAKVTASIHEMLDGIIKDSIE